VAGPWTRGITLRRSCMLAGEPWTLFITLIEEADSLKCTVIFQELDMDARTVDQWELGYDRVDEALQELEMSYGIDPDEWTRLDF